MLNVTRALLSLRNWDHSTGILLGELVSGAGSRSLVVPLRMLYQCTRFGTRALRRLKAAINTEMKLKAIQQYIYIYRPTTYIALCTVRYLWH